MAVMREQAAAKRAENSAAELQAKKKEKAKLEKELPGIVKNYEKAFDRACKATALEDITNFFDAADSQMGRIHGVQVRIRSLSVELDEQPETATT